MKKLLIIILGLFGTAEAQSIGYFRYDTAQFYKVGGNGEIKIMNSTRGVTGGVLTNSGNGWGQWVTPAASPTDWHITGNAGTSASTNFIGTTDAVSLRTKLNSLNWGILDVTTSYENIAIGRNSLGTSTQVPGYLGLTGRNVAIGTDALPANTGGAWNISLGWRSMLSNTTGAGNTALGKEAMASNTTGIRNVAIGNNALNDNTTSENNFAGGAHSLENATGGYNTAVGMYSLKGGALNTLYSTALGFNAQFWGGSHVVGIGYNAHGATANPHPASSYPYKSITIGDMAMYDVSGDSSIIAIGDSVSMAANLKNAIAIGSKAYVSASNSMVLGGVSGTNGATANMKVGIGTTTPDQTLHINGTFKLVDGSQGTNKILQSDNNGLATWVTPAGGGLTVGTTAIASGTDTRILYDNAGVLGEYTLTGTGTVVAMQTAPTFVTSISSPILQLPLGSGTNRDLQLQAENSGLDNIGGAAFYPLSGTNVGTSLRFIPRGTGFSAAVKAQMVFYNTDYIADAANPEALLFRTAGTEYGVGSIKAGTGVARPIFLDATGSFSLATANLLLNTDGTVTASSLAGATNGRAVVASTAGVLSAGAIVSSGTYTPTLTNVTNITTSTAYACQYLRVGNTVTVSGKVDIDVTLGAASELGFSLPAGLTSNFTAEENLGGTASSSAAASLVSAIKADATNDRAAFVFTAVSLTNDSYFFEFTYQIK